MIVYYLSKKGSSSTSFSEGEVVSISGVNYTFSSTTDVDYDYKVIADGISNDQLDALNASGKELVIDLTTYNTK